MRRWIDPMRTAAVCARQWRHAGTAAGGGSHAFAYKTAHVGKGQSPLPSAKSSSCATERPAEKRALTPLQRRMLSMKEKPAFSLTPNAVYRVKTLLAAHAENVSRNGGSLDSTPSDPPKGIRIGVKKRGCSGYSYTVTYDYGSTPKPEDVVVEESGFRVVVDGGALFYVIGTVMDFTVTDVEEKFTFRNPNERYKCGCQESFMPFDL